MAEFHHLLAEYGYVALVGLIALESMGIPLPGETVLVMASIHAGTRGGNIGLVIAAATLGAILGDNIGYVLGRELGFRFLIRFGSYLRLSDARIKLGQYLFMKHGAKVVFLLRFCAASLRSSQVSIRWRGRAFSSLMVPARSCGRPSSA